MRAATNAQLIKTAERRAYILGLRKAGGTYRQIAAQAIVHFGAENLPLGFDARYAYKDVKRELDRLRTQMSVDVEAVRQLALERLNIAHLAIWQQVRDGHLGAIDRFLRISDRRARLLGLDAPEKHEHEGAVINVTFSGNLDPNEF